MPDYNDGLLVRVSIERAGGRYDRARVLCYDYRMPTVEAVDLLAPPPPPDFDHMAVLRYQEGLDKQRRVIDMISANIAHEMTKALAEDRA